jgi:predicted enzyme related to lactoylglutathione lyase
MQPDPEAAVGFYGGLFGCEFEDVMPPDSPRRYFVARLRGLDVAAVGSPPEGGPQTAMWNTYFWVDSADETVSKVRDAGGQVVAQPVDVPPDAGRTAAFTDPEGATFRVWQAKRNKGAQLVNEPGSLNLNGLNTRDVEGAKSFYGSVLRRRTLTLDAGLEMWTLPGFGDFLERDNPDLRKQMTEADAPEGFEDVVGTITPIADKQPETPPHWSVIFATDDADATAAKTTELGGQVIVPPFDAPLGPDDSPQRSAGRDVHREQVRDGEQGTRQRSGRGRRGRLGRGRRRPTGSRRSLLGSPRRPRSWTKWAAR